MEGVELACLEPKLYARVLNIDAPILSTKRLGLSNGAEMLSINDVGTTQNAVSERIPFSWEQAAGRPKDMERNNLDDEDSTPRLRLPPALWHKQMIQHGENESSDDVFTDATDVFSLSEALDFVQKSDEGDESNFDGLKSKLAESSRQDHSPTYIITRFLPDATAAANAAANAAASASSCSQVTEIHYLQPCVSSGIYQSDRTSSPKACGLELLSPWRIKHKLCGAESPVQPCSPSLHKHHSRTTSKNKKRYDSSAYRNYNSVRRDS